MSQRDSGYRWNLPQVDTEARAKHQLKLLNSFTKKKETLVTSKARTISWYTCGPTVYDVAHLGHARCYITFDIIRRILADYFGYNIFFVMNITDIDDKIIKRARSNHLCAKYIDKHSKYAEFVKDPQTLLAEITSAIDNYALKVTSETDETKSEMLNKIIKNSRDSIQRLSDLSKCSEDIDLTEADNQLRNLLFTLSDVIAESQDHKFGHSVSDHEIFKELTIKYEEEFHQDMRKLGVLPPSALTRVSDYIEETGAFIEKLERNGFAYRAGGSVYFDTEKFDSDPKHSYAKLVREAYGQSKGIDEGEGELSVVQSDSKKSPNDFALWKVSKPGEPSWKTHNFEPGRPGWHIECSVMATHLLGSNFDLHSGGCDLKFPHHDNEIAQAEAYFDTGKDWVNYFLHSGHLTISGCKMSKSLKNFITIREALEQYTARQIRFAFLAHSWVETLDYSTNTMQTAASYEKTFREFFLNIANHLRQRCANSGSPDQGTEVYNMFQKWSSDDYQLNAEFVQTIEKVDASLCDNLDTRSVLNHLASLIKAYNKQTNPIALVLIRDITSYIQKILRIFGTRFDELDLDQVFKISKQPNEAGQSLYDNNSELTLKYVDALAKFRADIRAISKSGQFNESIKQILNLCDTLRDQTLPGLGVRLEDKEENGCPYVIKLEDPESLAREKLMAERREQEKRLKEETIKLEKLKLQRQREDKMKIPPTEMFTSQSDKYSKFDDLGMPTHDFAGKEISKSALKKLQRLYTEQEERYKRYLAGL